MSLEVTAPFAITAAKYLYNVAKKWWDERKENKEIEKNEPRIRRLLDEVEALKRQLEEKGREEISDEDVNLLRQQLVEVRHLEGAIKEDVASAKAFYTWMGSQVENEDLDVEELAEFYRLRLTKFIDKARQEGVNRKRLNKYNDLLSYIEVNLGMVRKAKAKERKIGTILAEQQRAEREYYLRTCLKDAEEALRAG